MEITTDTASYTMIIACQVKKVIFWGFQVKTGEYKVDGQF